MGKKEDLSDIFGDADTPATQKGKTMKDKGKKEEKGKPAAAPGKVAKAAPAKGKAAPAKGKAAPAKGNGASRGARGEGKFYFPADSKDFIALKAKVASLKKPTSTKDVAAALKTDTWKVRLVSVVLEQEKKLKRVKQGNVLMLQPK